MKYSTCRTIHALVEAMSCYEKAIEHSVIARGYSLDTIDHYEVAIGNSDDTSGYSDDATGYSVDASGYSVVAIGYSVDATGCSEINF